MSPLANEFDVRCVLHGQLSLSAVNQIHVFHEAMNGCKNLKINSRLALKMLIFHHEYLVLDDSMRFLLSEFSDHHNM